MKKKYLGFILVLTLAMISIIAYVILQSSVLVQIQVNERGMEPYEVHVKRGVMFTLKITNNLDEDIYLYFGGGGSIPEGTPGVLPGLELVRSKETWTYSLRFDTYVDIDIVCILTKDYPEIQGQGWPPIEFRKGEVHVYVEE